MGHIDDLQRNEVFRCAPHHLLVDLARTARPVRLASGSAVYEPGESSDGVWLLLSGQVRTVSAHRRLIPRVVLFTEPGLLVGVTDFLEARERTFRAAAHGTADLLHVPGAALHALLRAHPPSLMALALELSSVVRTVAGDLDDVLARDLPARLARHLLDDATTTSIPGRSQSDLAARLRVARQSLNQALGDLQRRGLIVLENGKAVQIADPAGLRRVAGLDSAND